jgi:hypothetical protein
MDTQPETTASSFVYNRLPTKVSRKDFNRYIEPHLYRPKKGPQPKLSLYKIFNPTATLAEHALLSQRFTGA